MSKTPKMSVWLDNAGVLTSDRKHDPMVRHDPMRSRESWSSEATWSQIRRHAVSSGVRRLCLRREQHPTIVRHLHKPKKCCRSKVTSGDVGVRCGGLDTQDEERIMGKCWARAGVGE